MPNKVEQGRRGGWSEGVDVEAKTERDEKMCKYDQISRDVGTVKEE